MSDTSQFDDANSVFWNELCGTHLANLIGVNDQSLESLNKYDSWYFDFYPYLKPWIDYARIDDGSKILEIGLGYGSTSRYLMKKYDYVGLDIAAGPVDMLKTSISEINPKNAIGVQGSALSLPFDDCSLDAVIAIGSLHHTGNLDLAIKEVHRVLRPGGKFIGMVYNIASARNFLLSPISTAKACASPKNSRVRAGERLRWLSDHDSSGTAAPTTEYLSKSALTECLKDFTDISISRKNVDDIPIPMINLRKLLLNTWFVKKFGLDLYFSCTK